MDDNHMNFDFVPRTFDIKVGDRVVGYLEEYEYRDWYEIVDLREWTEE